MKLVVTLATLVGFATAACPNSCSGHGTCDRYDACTCFKETPLDMKDFKGATISVEWTGADCSRRTCPRGISWAKSNTETDAGVVPQLAFEIDWKKDLDAKFADVGLSGPNVLLTFKWTGDMSLHQFHDEHAFNDCNMARSVELVPKTSPGTFTITKAGNYYFGEKTNCATQKTRIQVNDGSTDGTIENWDTATTAQDIVLTKPAKLTFQWKTGAHTVWKFKDKAAYTACDFTAGKGSEVGKDGAGTVFTAAASDDEVFFSSALTGECAAGNKMRLIQAAVGGAAVVNTGNNLRCFHLPEAECSDQGLCDRATGLCSCFPGYSGSSCQRTVCPDDCSGHGTCRSNRDFAYDWAVAKTKQIHDKTETNIEEKFKETYFASYDDAWDTDKHWGCKCDAGYRGPSCALVECPSAHDPLDDKCVGDSPTITDFQLQYDAPFGATGWEQAYSLKTGTVEESGDLTKSDFNPRYILDSNGRKVYACYGAMSGQDCSGRGICDYSSGTCKCFSGYAGTACEKVEEMA
jgi:hypothetical protein